MRPPLGGQRRRLADHRGRNQRLEPQPHGRAGERANRHPAAGAGRQRRGHPGRRRPDPRGDEVDLPARPPAGGAPGREVLAVGDDRRIAVAAHVGQRPGHDGGGLERGRRLGHHADGPSRGELGERRPLHPASAEGPAEVVGPGMHDRAVAHVDPVMRIRHGRPRDPSLHRQPLTLRHDESSESMIRSPNHHVRPDSPHPRFSEGSPTTQRGPTHDSARGSPCPASRPSRQAQPGWRSAAGSE